MRKPQIRLTPPPRRAPPGQQTGNRQAHPGKGTKDPRFRCHLNIYDASTTTPPQTTMLLARLPDPHLTRSRHAFSLTLTTTVFSQCSSGWFNAYPRGPTLEGQQSSI